MSTVAKAADQLLEAWGDVVPTSDSGWLQDYDSGYGTTLARYQRPATTLSDRLDGRFLPVYQTEFDLAVIRAMGRTLAQVSPALVGALRSMCNYTIGEGFIFTAARDVTADRPAAEMKTLVDAVQREINTLLDNADFVGSFDREIHNSSIEDGEVFLHLKPTFCGGVKISRCEPDQVRQPAASRDLEDWVQSAFDINCDEFVSSWSFGVHTRADEPDVPLGYHVVADESGVDWEYIPASRMVHIKRNVPRNAKRGFSDFYPIEADSTRGEKLRRNMAEGAAVQSAIAYVRQHVQGTTRLGVEQMLGENKVGTSQQQLSQGASRSRSVVQYRPGTVVDLSAGLEYKPGPMGSDRANDFMVVAQYVQRMQAVRWSMPEYLFTGDASNANYSSTLVAESPFVKSCEAEQRFYSRHFVSALWKALQIRWEQGAFEQFGVSWDDLEELIDIKAECPTVATRDELANVQRQEILIRLGVLSRKTAASQNGLDFEAEVALGATPEGQSGEDSARDGTPSGAQVPMESLSESVLLECGGKGGKPGPCAKPHAPKSKQGHRARGHLDSPESSNKTPDSSLLGAGLRRWSRAQKNRPLDKKKRTDDHARVDSSTPHTEPQTDVLTGKSKTATRNSNPNTRDRQEYAKECQKRAAKGMGGEEVDNNAPADITVSTKAGLAQVEFKAVLDRKSDTIGVRRAALERKARLSAETGNEFHMVIEDQRYQYNRDQNHTKNFSQHDLYYKRGAGTCKLEEMYKAKDYEDLKRVMALSDEDLPIEARATPQWKAMVAGVPTWDADRGKLKGSRAIAAQTAANERKNG